MHMVHLSTVEQVVTLGTVVQVILAQLMELKHQVMKTVASMLATTEDSTPTQITTTHISEIQQQERFEFQ